MASGARCPAHPVVAITSATERSPNRVLVMVLVVHERYLDASLRAETFLFVLYRKGLKRVLLFAVLLILFADASGAMAFVSAETCTSASDSAPDNACPPLCVRCGCCAQPVVPTVELSLAEVLVSFRSPTPYFASPRVGSPHDILHVPK